MRCSEGAGRAAGGLEWERKLETTNEQALTKFEVPLACSGNSAKNEFLPAGSHTAALSHSGTSSFLSLFSSFVITPPPALGNSRSASTPHSRVTARLSEEKPC